MGVLEVDAVDETAVGVSVLGGIVGVTVGKRPSGVIVGTGDKSTACMVPIRSCGLPVAGISIMIWLRMFSLMGGTAEA
jgi:hypothetical protein